MIHFITDVRYSYNAYTIQLAACFVYNTVYHSIYNHFSR